jgi:hypothetical protein
MGTPAPVKKRKTGSHLERRGGPEVEMKSLLLLMGRGMREERVVVSHGFVSGLWVVGVVALRITMISSFPLHSPLP